MKNHMFDAEYFQCVYKNYDLQNPPNKMAFYRKLVEEVTTRNQFVLDVGCGLGNFLSKLHPHYQCFGIDASSYAISQAKQKNPEISSNLVQSDIEKIPFNHSFDIITAFDVIEHIEDLSKVINAVKSNLTSSGHFIFSVPVYDGPTGLLIKILDKDPTHVHKKSRNFWLHWAEKYFFVKKWRGIYRLLFPGGYYLHLPTKLFRNYAPAMVVVCQNTD